MRRGSSAIRAEAARVVRAAFYAGETAEAIAARYGIATRTVYRWMADSRERPSRTVAGRILAERKG